jgi:hypothetical protein
MNAVLAYSAQELAHYVRRLTGIRWDVRAVGQVTRKADTAWLGLWVDVGVQAIRPVDVLIVMPVGACVSE